MRPVDQAHGFATFAAKGKERDPFFVRKVVDSSGKVLLEQKTAGPAQQAVSEDVAHDVTYALTDVAAYSRRSLDGGRPVAAKTGTQGLDDVNNSDAWIVGYTPSISTSVWMGTDKRLPIINSDGGIIYGSGLPGEIWQQFMNNVLEGQPIEPLPDSPLIKGDTGESVELPAPTTSASSSSQASTPSPKPKPEPQPVDNDGDGVFTPDDPNDNDPNDPTPEEPPAPGAPATTTSTKPKPPGGNN